MMDKLCKPMQLTQLIFILGEYEIKAWGFGHFLLMQFYFAGELLKVHCVIYLKVVAIIPFV